MRNVAAKLLASTGVLLLASGCATSNSLTTASAPSPSRHAPRNVARAPSSASYVASASSIELYEIESAQLALQRATSRRVRDFAAMVLDAHKGASMQLSLAGRRLNLLPSATLNAAHQAMMDELRATPGFDSAYVEQQMAVHRDALSLHRNYAALGTSPTLRPVAASLVPVFQRYLRLLGNL